MNWSQSKRYLICFRFSVCHTRTNMRKIDSMLLLLFLLRSTFFGCLREFIERLVIRIGIIYFPIRSIFRRHFDTSSLWLSARLLLFFLLFAPSCSDLINDFQSWFTSIIGSRTPICKSFIFLSHNDSKPMIHTVKDAWRMRHTINRAVTSDFNHLGGVVANIYRKHHKLSSKPICSINDMIHLPQGSLSSFIIATFEASTQSW